MYFQLGFSVEEKNFPVVGNDFMKLFVDEAKVLCQNGICIKNKTYNFSVYTSCYDVPAKSFLLQIKGHSGFFSCTRCEVVGRRRIFVQQKMFSL